MIPILYSEYSSNMAAIGRLDECVSCFVTEERNGVYECEFVYPVTGEYYDQIQKNRILGATHDDVGDVQYFVIYSRTAPIDGMVTFYASHISYMLNTIVLEPFTASTCAAAIAAIPGKSINTNPFTFWTDKSTTADFVLAEPKQCRAVLGGEEGSFLDIFGGGEYEFDNLTVKLHAHRGSDSGVTIRYGKNLVDLTQEVDAGGLYEAIVPYWLDAETGTVVLATDVIVARTGYSGTLASLKTVALDMSGDFEEQPTRAQLQTAAQTWIDGSNAWVQSENIQVDFVALWQTEEYKDYAPLQRVRLCDTVSIYYPELGITAVNQKVIKTVFDVLQDRYDSIEIGELQSTLGDTILKAVDIDLSDYPTKGYMESVISGEIQEATDAITGGNGGYVQIHYNANDKPYEITIADNEDINQASKVWRWNMGGLGYSSSGYSGTYGTAITMNGAIVADFITTGTLNANVIRAGVLTDLQNNNYWDLSTGEFRLAASATIGGSTLSSQLSSLQSTLESEIDAKVETWAQSTDPAASWTTSALQTEHNGDLWLYTGMSDLAVGGVTIHPQGVYQFDSSTGKWAVYSSTSSNLFDLADGKKRIYYGTTSGTYSPLSNGDYLVDNTTGKTYKWNGSSWDLQTDYAGAISTYDTGLDQQKVFNKLTNNGQTQGIYLQNGLLYINASYIATGTLTDTAGNTSFDLSTGTLTMAKGSINLGNGVFTVDNSGNVVANSFKAGNFQLTDNTDGSYALQADSTISGTKSRVWIRAAKSGAGHGFGTMAFAVQKGSSYDTVFAVTANGAISAWPGAGNVSFNVDTTHFTVGANGAWIDVGKANNVWSAGMGGADGSFVSVGGQNASMHSAGDTLIDGSTVAIGVSSAFSVAPYVNGAIDLSNEYFRVTPAGNVVSYKQLFVPNARTTTGSSAAITSNGEIVVSSSSKRYKRDIRTIKADATALYGLDVREFKYKAGHIPDDDERFDKFIPGFIAEEVDELFPIAAVHNAEGLPEDWDVRVIVPMMLKLLQEQHKEIELLKGKIN